MYEKIQLHICNKIKVGTSSHQFASSEELMSIHTFLQQYRLIATKPPSRTPNTTKTTFLAKHIPKREY